MNLHRKKKKQKKEKKNSNSRTVLRIFEFSFAREKEKKRKEKKRKKKLPPPIRKINGSGRNCITVAGDNLIATRYTVTCVTIVASNSTNWLALRKHLPCLTLEKLASHYLHLWSGRFTDRAVLY